MNTGGGELTFINFCHNNIKFLPTVAQVSLYLVKKMKYLLF